MPDRASQLADADDFRKLKYAVAPYSDYREMLEQVADVAEGDGPANEFNSASKSIDEVMFESKSRIFSMAFEN